MNYLLFGGAPQTGKTSSITRIVDYLINQKGYVIVNQFNYLPSQNTVDFKVILEKKSKLNNKRIYVNTASDTKRIIKDCKHFLNNNTPVDIIVSSVRDKYSPRTNFFKIMNVNMNLDYVLEIPLGKVSRGKNRLNCLNWYNTKIDEITQKILDTNPYNV